MRKITSVVLLLLVTSFTFQGNAQEDRAKPRIKVLEQQKTEITKQEKQALKEEVKSINERLDKGLITEAEAQILKEEAARKRAMNIENRLAIIDNKIEFLQRNGIDASGNDPFENDSTRVALFEEDRDFFGIKFGKKSELPKRNKRTNSDLVLGLGLHNNVISGEAFFDTPHSILGSRYFELGILWKTRLLRNSNWLRLNYGIIYESKGLRTPNNKLFVEVNEMGQTDIQLDDAENVFLDDFRGDLKKSKVRQDAFIFPVHLEFGPSTKKQYGEYIRYSTHKKFRLGLGAYFGFGVRSIQKIKFSDNTLGGNQSSNDRRPFGIYSGNNANDTFWGWSVYAGEGDTTIVFKLEGSDNFLSSSTQGTRQNISLGVRFEL